MPGVFHVGVDGETGEFLSARHVQPAALADPPLSTCSLSLPSLQTNVVSVDLMANSLLAVGASPAMVSSPEEAGDFARDHASVVLVNVGTLNPTSLAGQHAAVDAAVAAGKPWVLDPVGCGATSYRTAATVALAHKRPALIRGNASGIAALAAAVAGRAAAGTVRGVDSTLASADAAAKELAAALGCVAAVSGASDRVVWPNGSALVVHGDVPELTAITATGCTVTALCAAAIGAAWAGGRRDDTALAAAAGLAAMGVAAERAVAAGGVQGPASLRVRLVDELAGLDGSGLRGVRLDHIAAPVPSEDSSG